jgi:hypothetical protein
VNGTHFLEKAMVIQKPEARSQKSEVRSQKLEEEARRRSQKKKPEENAAAGFHSGFWLLAPDS